MNGRTREELFRAGAVLTGSSPTSEVRPADLKTILLKRIKDFYALFGQDESALNEASTETVQLETATAALTLLEHLHEKITYRGSTFQSGAPQKPAKDGDPHTESDPSLVGTRDLALIRTLMSIVFKWAIEPLVQRIVSAIPSTSALHITKGRRFIDLTGLPHEYSTLSSMTTKLLALPLSGGLASPITQSAVSATLLNQHLSDLLHPCIILGWLPKSLSSDSMQTVDTIRPQVMYLLSRLPVSTAISALGKVLSKSSASLPYARKACTHILSRQLLRPEGIRGLCESVFAEEDVSGEDVPLEKLEHIARLLGTIPSGMKPEEYCDVMVPRMLLLLSLGDTALSLSHKRAIAFSLSRSLTNDEAPAMQAATSRIAFPTLHNPILHGTGDLSAAASLRTVEVLLTNTDPSPPFISTLLTPIIPSLYALLAHLDSMKASDPLLRETLKGYLDAWGRLLGSAEIITTLQKIIGGEGGSWRVDIAGEIYRTDDAAPDPTSLSLFTPESLQQAEEAGELDVDSNILGLKPEPVRFVRLVQDIGRADVSSELFVRLLEGYRELRDRPDANPLRTLLYLQLVVQMQKISSDDASNVLSKPEHVLTFVKHALEGSRSSETPAKTPVKKQGLGVEDLRIVQEEIDELDDGDSDDEEEGGQSEQTVDDITSTAVKLLLSLLEAHPDLSARSAPSLNDIFELLEPLTRVPNDDLRALAREARMVMTARLASTSASANGNPTKRSTDETETPQETYQKALKLLQDPLLPVRAHGLLLLRQLVAPGPGLTRPVLDDALVPGILAVFLEAAHDDDSYVFLNAVQGLAAMADGFGRDVLRALVRAYAGGLDDPLAASALRAQDVDVRTRVGEALGQVVRRCGEALPAYAELLVPPLFAVVRAGYVPAVLRASAVSLLAQCVRTNTLAVLPYVVDLADAMVDLLRIESVAAAQARPPAGPRSDSPSGPAGPGREDADEGRQGGAGGGNENQGAETSRGERGAEKDKAPQPPRLTRDTQPAQPTSANAKVPPLRRAALHFLALLVQACTARVYETGDVEGALVLPPQLMTRAKTTLGYVAATDADDVVRVMARETMEALDQFAEALVGL